MVSVRKFFKAIGTAVDVMTIGEQLTKDSGEGALYEEGKSNLPKCLPLYQERRH
jgi:hypothetical protein